MNSTVNLVSDDEDDDGIDWSEACREIDMVCETASLASTSSMPPEKPSSFNRDEKRNDGKVRIRDAKQSTLDRFIAKAAPRPPQPVEVPAVLELSEQNPAGVEIDPQAAKTWIYPVNVPLRDYQFAITKTALFSNTLVALPTGLGKTLIAAVVIYNYFRWFPDGKIVFAAPSRPLVMQQIEACHNVVGIPQELTIDMTGQVSPSKRARFWKSKRVFFVTPQVLEKDIQSGTCLVKHLVCLVIDEAHRALGNYSSSVAVRELMDVPVQLRILALTATPGSKQQTIQQIIDNLHISTLEYRNESDHDVSKYIHNRKIELIQVALGQEAVEINDKLSDVMKPYLRKLYDWRVLPYRDDKTLSPCELLTSREKFRQAPPPSFTNFDSRDAEGYFGLLITLCHMRKLLLSHGIRPAYEMLEEKLKLGSFARYMSRNEDLSKAKVIMQGSLSNGAPSPKLSKMLEVLLDHFKTKDPENSRVIIFSNFRGSVRDIMDALVNVGNFVKATQFIGQSSGKTSKGQSQKVQQAVLEKFRSGGYNVIVATSIGEEGLDIMEVDLVICFDANISPLRMIQRMGRTGRKHDGRVVVLACEGSELKGYTRKQANSKAVGKHMRNGGINSFTFHPSPRMVPHIYKPEVQYVELSIEKFIRNGKKVKDDDTPKTPVYKEKLTDVESSLIAKYFHPPSGSRWKPSLIAFPHFQTFPSRVHTVKHSYKTGLLIGIMQRLKGLSFPSDRKILPGEDEVYLKKGLGVDNIEPDKNKEDFVFADDSSDHNTRGNLLDSEASSGTRSLETDKNTVLTFKEAHPKNTSESSTLLNCFDEHLKNVDDNKDEVQAGAVQDGISHTRCREYGSPRWSLCSSDALEDKTNNGFERFPQTPIRNRDLLDEIVAETPDDKIKTLSLLPDESINDIELSPRLTNMIKSGFVPESPIESDELSNDKERDICHVPEPVSTAQLHIELSSKSSVLGKNKIVNMESDSFERNISVFPVSNEVQTPIFRKVSTAGIRGRTSPSPIADRSESPLVDLTNTSCSKNWCLSIGEKSESVERTRKFKRLRKIGDYVKNENLKRAKDSSLVPRAMLASGRGGNRKPINNKINVYIDEEAEVSDDDDMSDDEEDFQDNGSHDSFIDDRTCLTNTATQSATSNTDMMAIYRRSLLSQSPMLRFPSGSPTPSPHSSAVTTTRTSETGNSSGKPPLSLHSPLTDYANCSITSKGSKPYLHVNHSAKTVPCTTGSPLKTEGRKRKLSFCPSNYVPAINLEKEFQLQCANNELLIDDQFYDGIDFDAVEAQATLLLKQKSGALMTQKQETIVPQHLQSPRFDSPSFDLGI